MSGTPTGGEKAAKTNKEKHGEDFYKRIGAKGGEKSRGGGFTGDPKRASEAGKAGVKKRWAKYYAEKGEN